MRYLASSALAAASLFIAADAAAAYHLMNIVEVNVGADGYVVLEMHAGGQNVTNGHTITVYSTGDTVLDTVTLTNVTNGAKNAKILIGTATVEAAFGVKPDFATMKALPPAGGKVCFDMIDCFAWGNYPAAQAATGAPFQFSAGKVAARDVSGGATSALDGTEDTNDSAADFDVADPSPKNNAGEVADAGTSSSSSSSSNGGTSGASGSDSGSDSGTSGTSGASGTSGSPSSSGTSTTSGTPAAPTSTDDDGGCNATGESTTYALVPALGLLLATSLLRRRSRR